MKSRLFSLIVCFTGAFLIIAALIISAFFGGQ